jgi:glycosyltransferase 2 family protein
LLVDPGSIPVLAGLVNSGSRLPVILLIAALVLLGIGIFRRRIFKWVEQRREYFRWKNISAALLLYLAIFLFFGYFIALMLDGVWSISYTWYRLSFGFAFSWLIGFIIPGAPGGIGIREVVFTGLFGSQLGEGVAITLALIIRIVTTLSDVVTFISAYIFSRLKPNAHR